MKGRAHSLVSTHGPLGYMAQAGRYGLAGIATGTMQRTDLRIVVLDVHSPKTKSNLEGPGKWYPREE